MSIDHTPQTAPPAPHLSLVKNPPAAPAAEPKKLTVEPRPRPEWMKSGKVLKQYVAYGWANSRDFAGHHATHLPYYVVWSPRGYWRLAKRWRAARHDDYPQMINSAKRDLRNAQGNLAAEAKANAVVTVRRAEYAAHKKKHRLRTAIWTTAGVTGSAVTVAAGPWWLDLLFGAGAVGVGAYHGRPEKPAAASPRAPRRPSQLGEQDMRRVLVEAGVVPEKRREEIRGVGLPHQEGPGIAYTVDLPSGIPASAALGTEKKKQIASALHVHVDWMDLDGDRGAGSSESRLKVWVSSQDPYSVVRASPLLDHKGPVNTFRDGIPVSFGKRGNPIILYLRDTSLIVAGATRRGKGVLLANILIGAAKDPWLNVRLFDGKGTAEHNPFAPLAATFVKRNPSRLAVTAKIVVEEINRRSDLLDEHGYEKIDDENYEEVMRLLGGRELIIVDELATYTPKGVSPWADETVEDLQQTAAVGAALGVTLISLTQVPEVDVIRGRLRQNHVARAAMNTESPAASNTILGDGMAGQGYDASKIPISQPGRHWLATPETGVIEARSYLIKPEDKRKVVAEAYEIRKAAGRLPGQWHDPIETALTARTGVSSAAGGARGNGRIIRFDLLETLEAAARATGRDCATNAEVFQVLAKAQPSKYGRLQDETDRAWASRIGGALVDELEQLKVPLKAKKVTGPDGQRTLGYLLADVTTARNARQ